MKTKTAKKLVINPNDLNHKGRRAKKLVLPNGAPFTAQEVMKSSKMSLPCVLGYLHNMTDSGYVLNLGKAEQVGRGKPPMLFLATKRLEKIAS